MDLLTRLRLKTFAYSFIRNVVMQPILDHKQHERDLLKLNNAIPDNKKIKFFRRYINHYRGRDPRKRILNVFKSGRLESLDSCFFCEYMIGHQCSQHNNLTIYNRMISKCTTYIKRGKNGQ